MAKRKPRWSKRCGPKVEHKVAPKVAIDAITGELFAAVERLRRKGKFCPYWPRCGCGTQSGPHTCEWQEER